MMHHKSVGHVLERNKNTQVSHQDKRKNDLFNKSKIKHVEREPKQNRHQRYQEQRGDQHAMNIST